MSRCSKSLGLTVDARDIAPKLPVPTNFPAPRHHAARPGRTHVDAWRVQDTQGLDADAHLAPARWNADPGRPPTGNDRSRIERPVATTHTWGVAPDIRCRCGRVQPARDRCASPPAVSLALNPSIFRTGVRDQRVGVWSGASSERISMRQPVSRAANRAF